MGTRAPCSRPRYPISVPASRPGVGRNHDRNGLAGLERERNACASLFAAVHVLVPRPHRRCQAAAVLHNIELDINPGAGNLRRQPGVFYRKEKVIGTMVKEGVIPSKPRTEKPPPSVFEVRLIPVGLKFKESRTRSPALATGLHFLYGPGSWSGRSAKKSKQRRIGARVGQCHVRQSGERPAEVGVMIDAATGVPSCIPGVCQVADRK